MNFDVDISDFCEIKNLLWFEDKPVKEMEGHPRILFESIIDVDLFKICCKLIGKKKPVGSFFGTKKLKNF